METYGFTSCSTRVTKKTVKIAGQMTDSGGGGTLESVAKELRLLGVANVLVYSIGSCTLHLLQLALSTPTKKVYGDGGRGVLNVMQLLHSRWWTVFAAAPSQRSITIFSS